jgi:hypothetical protein
MKELGIFLFELLLRPLPFFVRLRQLGLHILVGGAQALKLRGCGSEGGGRIY